MARSPSDPFIPVMGKLLLRDVRHDIARTIAPSWLKRSPDNLGDPKQGKLSSKEWRSVFGVSFLITLVRVWGKDYPKEQASQRTGAHKILDNFVHLILALQLSTQAIIDERIVDLYEHHMQQYLEGFRILYPTHSITPYHHLSLHFPTFMRLLGPWDSWGAGPYETYNGMSQRIPTNQTFGERISCPTPTPSKTYSRRP